MRNRIPPPLLTLAAGGLMWIISGHVDILYSKTRLTSILGWGAIFAGLAVLVLAVIEFKNRETTVNPFRPENASTLVVEGLYKFVRHPMYFGMTLVLAGWMFVLGQWLNVVVLFVFRTYLVETQIKTEEQVLTAKFGQDYIDYMKRVRRWI